MIYRELAEVTIVAGERCCPDVCGRAAVVRAVVTYADTSAEFMLCPEHWQTMQMYWGFLGGVIVIDDDVVAMLADAAQKEG